MFRLLLLWCLLFRLLGQYNHPIVVCPCPYLDEQVAQWLGNHGKHPDQVRVVKQCQAMHRSAVKNVGAWQSLDSLLASCLSLSGFTFSLVNLNISSVMWNQTEKYGETGKHWETLRNCKLTAATIAGTDGQVVLKDGIVESVAEPLLQFFAWNTASMRQERINWYKLNKCCRIVDSFLMYETIVFVYNDTLWYDDICLYILMFSLFLSTVLFMLL